MNEKHNIYIGLGTNLGNLEENLNKAIDLIQINYKIKSKSNISKIKTEHKENI